MTRLGLWGFWFLARLVACDRDGPGYGPKIDTPLTSHCRGSLEWCVMAVRRVRDIDWTSWRAVDPATLVFVIKGDRILLIRKKRGLGAGKVNGPGGRLEAGETFGQCAVREVQEELGVTP